MSVVFLSLLLELIQQAALVVFKHSENLENLVWNILKKKLHIS